MVARTRPGSVWRWEPGAFSCLSYKYRSQRPWAFLCCFLKPSAGNRIESGAAVARISSHMDCQLCRHTISLLCHCTGPIDLYTSKIYIQGKHLAQWLSFLLGCCTHIGALGFKPWFSPYSSLLWIVIQGGGREPLVCLYPCHQSERPRFGLPILA